MHTGTTPGVWEEAEMTFDPTKPMSDRAAHWLRVNGMQTREDLARNHVRLVRTPNRRAAGGGLVFLALVSALAVGAMAYAAFPAVAS